MKITGLFVLLVLLCGCSPMRDYVGVKDGHFGLEVERGFGEGEEKKKYYTTREGIILDTYDSKNEVTKKIGVPDAIDQDIEGLECWRYEDRKLKLFFLGDRLKMWEK